MERIKKYGKLDLMNIDIKYGKQRIQFNLFEEAKIKDEEGNHQLIVQPAYYGFIFLLHKRLLTQFEDAKQRRKRIWSREYLKAKQGGVGAKYLPDAMAEAKANSSKSFKNITSLCIKLKDNADTLYACVKAFEQRKDLLQTISSNNRKF